MDRGGKMARAGGRAPRLAAAVAVAAVALSCARLDRKLVSPAQVDTLDGDSKYLKVHLVDGGLYLLSDWKVSRNEDTITGVGDRFDANRNHVESGSFTVHLGAVALFETNVVHRRWIYAWMTLVTGASLGVTYYCTQNQKACFGSCPTVYASDGERTVLQAEAFSAAVAPSLEARDVDALYRAKVDGDTLELRVTNEALETHVIRRADLLVAERRPGERVFATGDGRFVGGRVDGAATACEAASGSCVDAVAAFDGVEYHSETDGRDLGATELVDFELPPARAGETAGVVVAARQTFVTTFLFYTALSYLGSRAGELFAELARRPDVRDAMRAVNARLGRVELLAPTPDGDWRVVGWFTETGPIATDVQLVELPPWAAAQRRFRLRMARGHWRVDWIARATSSGEAMVRRVAPSSVRFNGGADPDALERLIDPDAALTTLPGDAYTLIYSLPEARGERELFLDAQGYYLEWMRREWVARENPLGAAMMLLAPDLALRILAPEFKRLEPTMERVFWGSRYANP